MYVAVKGGERAIEAAEALVNRRRRGDPAVPALSLEQLAQQLSLAVDRVMAEGGLADPALAALALKQARGDSTEAAFLLRAYRTTLARAAVAVAPVDPTQMRLERRISAIFKDLPGGQLLGPTVDYTHRLLDFALAAEEEAREGAQCAGMDCSGIGCAEAGHDGAGHDGAPLHPPPPAPSAPDPNPPQPVASALEALIREGLLPGAAPAGGDDPVPAPDITRDTPSLPYTRAQWQQRLTSGDEGMLVALAYSSQRGWGHQHPFVGDLRVGYAAVRLQPDPERDPDLVLDIGDILLTECRMVTGFTDEGETAAATGPQFTEGYALVPGHNERKALAIALIDRALAAAETRAAAEEGAGEAKPLPPVADQAFILDHCDGVEASGFLQHLKLPHYVDFQSELAMLRHIRRQWAERATAETVAVPTPLPTE